MIKYPETTHLSIESRLKLFIPALLVALDFWSNIKDPHQRFANNAKRRSTRNSLSACLGVKTIGIYAINQYGNLTYNRMVMKPI